MSTAQIIVLVALSVYAVYRQTVRHPVRGRLRFKLAAIYIAVGLVAGGLHPPPTVSSWALLAVSVLLSVAVGVARGWHTRIWVEGDGQVYSKGTLLTIGLFLALIGSKYALGAWQYLSHRPLEQGGFGEAMLMIGVMVAMQAEIVWRRAKKLHASPASSNLAAGAPSS